MLSEPKLVTKTSPPSGFSARCVGVLPTSSSASRWSCCSEASCLPRHESGAAPSQIAMTWCAPEQAMKAFRTESGRIDRRRWLRGSPGRLRASVSGCVVGVRNAVDRDAAADAVGDDQERVVRGDARDARAASPVAATAISRWRSRSSTLTVFAARVGDVGALAVGSDINEVGLVVNADGGGHLVLCGIDDRDGVAAGVDGVDLVADGVDGEAGWACGRPAARGPAAGRRGQARLTVFGRAVGDVGKFAIVGGDSRGNGSRWQPARAIANGSRATRRETEKASAVDGGAELARTSSRSVVGVRRRNRCEIP